MQFSFSVDQEVTTVAQNEVEQKLLDTIELGGIYQHSKNKEYYKVIHIARSCDDCSLYVVYQALYDNKFGSNIVWLRRLEEFLEKRIVDGVLVDRFKYIKKAA